MRDAALAEHYRRYIDTLNERPVGRLEPFVHEQVIYKRESKSLSEYRALIEDAVAAASDLVFRIGLLVVEGEMVAAKLDFDCTPKGCFIGIETDGRRVAFSEHVFYRFSGGKICLLYTSPSPRDRS